MIETQSLSQAQNGNIEAQYDLGIRYLFGDGLEKNPATAVHWLKKAAEQGHNHAQYLLGNCYSKGEGVTQNQTEAIYCYEKASENGHDLAQYRLGVCYINGNGVNRDLQKAVFWLEKSAVQENEYAQNILGVFYSDTNPELSVYWHKRAANSGNLESMIRLAHLFFDNKKYERDIDVAIEWAEKAAEKDSIEGMLIASNLLSIRARLSKSTGWFRDALDDLMKATKMIETAIQHGYKQENAAEELSSLFNLSGDCYYKENCHSEAVECYKKSNKHNSILQLGIISTLEQKVRFSTDDQRGIFNRLAGILPSNELDQLDNATGFYVLSEMLRYGEGIPQNLDSAYNCMLRASNLGFEPAKKVLRSYIRNAHGNWEIH